MNRRKYLGLLRITGLAGCSEESDQSTPTEDSPSEPTVSDYDMELEYEQETISPGEDLTVSISSKRVLNKSEGSLKTI